MTGTPSKATAAPDFRLCSLVARAHEEQLIGTAPNFDQFIAVEVNSPWPRNVWQADHAPPGLSYVLDQAEQQGLKIRAQALGPDTAYSQPGQTRVLYFRRPAELFARYDKETFILPAGQVAPLVEALLNRSPAAVSFDRYRQPHDDRREILVCTHGRRDTCCGKFGYALYTAFHRQAQQRPDRLRVWRTSHISGHRFAPTLIDLPHGHYWGHFEAELLPGLIEREEPVAALLPYYRGWSGLSQFEQIADREIWRREGWAWLDYRKQGHTLQIDETAGSVTVRLDFAGPETGLSGAYEATITAQESVLTLKSSGDEVLEPVKQYGLKRLVRAGSGPNLRHQS